MATSVKKNKKITKTPGGITGKGFVPGVCPNPSGRPKGRSLTTILQDILERKVELKDPFSKKAIKRPIKEQIMVKLIANALTKGPQSLSAIKEVLDRMEGKSLQRLEHSGPDGDDIPHEIKVSFVDAPETKKKPTTKKKKRGS